MGDFMLESVNKILWGFAIALLLFTGFYFSIICHFPQFKINKILNSLTLKKDRDSSISSFDSLMMVLAGRIGVGSLAGTALAIFYGGAGSIFWMWIITIVGAIHTYAETILGNIYKEKDFKNIYKGGPMYYIKNGLNNSKLGFVYASLILIAYVGGFIGIQANTINKSLNNIFFMPSILVGVIVVLFTGMVIFGGIERISKITSKLVPFMTLFYVFVTFLILINNFNKIPSIIKVIFVEAFNIKSFIGGFIPSFIIGIQRGLFAIEAGLGTGSIASSVSGEKDSIKLGYIQILGVYITMFLICTPTALVILSTNYLNYNLNDINGIELTQNAFNYYLGNFGNYFIFICILLFSFSTILTGYYYGESSLKYILNKVTKKSLFILKIITLIVIFIGTVMSPTLLWKIVDILVALLAIINVYSMYSLKSSFIYNKKINCGKM